MARLVPICLLLMLLSGCGMWNEFVGGTDNRQPPAPLTPIANPVVPAKVWQTDVKADSTEAFVRLSPSLREGKLYVAGFNGRVAALDAASGRQKWGTDFETQITGGVGSGEGLVILAGPNGGIVALDGESGSEIWRTQVSSEVLSPPQAAQGVAVVRTVDGKLFGIDVATGEQLWSLGRVMPALSLRGTSPPLLIPNTIIIGLDNGKVAVVELQTGRVYWERTVSPPRGRSELDRMVDIDAQPVLIGRVLYVVTYQGKLAALDVESAQTVWSRDMSAFSGLAVGDDAVYVTDSDSAVWAMDRRTGAALWMQDILNNRGLTGPALAGDYLVVGDFEGYLHWLSRSDGRLVARTRVGNDAISVAPVSDGSTLYALGVGGAVAAYRAP